MAKLDSFKELEEERKTINNELINKSYRNFCKQNDLKFHFWDELPKNKFNPEIARKENKLHNEAMNCFNNLKPRFVLFNGKIYSFHFTDWGGDFDYECWEIQDFLDLVYNEMNKAKIFKKKLNTSVNILTIVIAILIIILTMTLDMMFIRLPVSFLSLVIGFGIAIWVGYLIKRKFIDNPINNLKKEKEYFVKRLSILKQQFTSEVNKSIKNTDGEE